MSDNATTYIDSAESLNELCRSPSLKEALGRKEVNWRFIPRRAPWYGGFRERLVALTKRPMRKTLDRTPTTFIEFQVLVVEIEATLNDRPLTYVSSDICDEEPLTPTHPLYGRRVNSLPFDYGITSDDLTDPNYSDSANIRRRVKLQAHLLQRFRNRWRHEWLTSSD
ncbi:uncharacterized protein LOC141892876 [Acropora palmata]|uniref:uncharacterized protein LOC141892876 n=1 Tax=Acropora palmata TaxID=6131 RepID=UPI003D9FE9A1